MIDLLQIDPFLLTVLVVGGVLLLLIIGYAIFSFSNTRRAVVERAHRVGNQTQAAVDAAVKLNLRRDTSDSSIAGLDRLVKVLLPRPAQLRDRLKRTGRDISLGVFFLCTLLTLVVVTALALHFLHLGFVPALLFGIAMGFGLPRFVVTRMINRRTKRFTAQFADAVDIIVRGLKAGLPVSESIRIVGQELTGPVADEFTGISEAMRLGNNFDDVLWQVAARVGTAEFKFFVICMSVQKETGGNLAETLANLSDILRKRRAMRGKIKAMSSEARASAIIIGSLPFIVFGVLFATTPSYVLQLFDDSRGVVMVILAATSMFTGIAIMAKMVKFEI